jgi:hypothetical protein
LLVFTGAMAGAASGGGIGVGGGGAGASTSSGGTVVVVGAAAFVEHLLEALEAHGGELRPHPPHVRRVPLGELH